MKPEETIDFQLRWVWYNVVKHYNNEAAEHGVTMAIGYSLVSIDEDEGIKSTQLGPKMGMEPGSLTRTLKKMEDLGFIYRQTDKEDRRIVRIFLTELGAEKRQIARNSVINLNTKIQELIDPKDLESFFKVMRITNSFLENKED